LVCRSFSRRWRNLAGRMAEYAKFGILNKRIYADFRYSVTN
jgi:hypothetical protein